LPATLLQVLHDDCLDLAIAARGRENVLTVALDAATMLAGGPERYRDATPQATHRLEQSLATLRAQLLPSDAAWSGYRLEAQALAELDGGPRGARGERLLPVVTPEQVYFVPGRKVSARFDPELPDDQGYGWHHGAVSVMHPEEVAAVQGARPRLLYYSSRTFLADRSLTDAQLDRRLLARLHAVPPHERERLAAALAFDHAVLVRQHGAAMARLVLDLAPRLNEAARADHDSLRLILDAARHPDSDAGAVEARLRADLALAAFAMQGGAVPDPNLPTIERVSAVVARLRPDE